MKVKINSINGKSAMLEIVDPSEHIQRCWAAGRFYEANKNGILAYLLNNSNQYAHKRCLDIGASIGNHTVYFSKILECEVISFEPISSSFEHLQKNCKLNQITPTLYNIGLGEKSGTASFKNNSKTHYNVGMFQLIDGSGIKIEPLDNITVGQINFIKIDVEHYNIPLLKGAKETLMSQKSCDVFIECESTEILQRTDELMIQYGYNRVPNLKLNHTPTYLWKK